MDDDRRINPFHFGQNLPGRRRRVRRELSRDDVGNQSRFLLTQFIHDRMVSDGLIEAPEAEELIEPGTPTGPPVDDIRDVASALKRIGDELDGDDRLQNLICCISPQDSRQTFFNVAMQLFADGNFNWGRVVALFYFAYKMVLRAIQQRLNQLPFLRSIIEWTVHFIIDHVAPWIIERGGWTSIQEYFGPTTLQALGVFLSGAVISIVLIVWNRLRSR